MQSERQCSWEAVLEAAEQQIAGAPVSGHAATCAECGSLAQGVVAARSAFAEWRSFDGGDPAAAERLSAAVVAAARGRQPVASAWRAQLEVAGQRLVDAWAVLTGDSWGGMTAMAAVRAAGVSGPRLLQYATDEYSVALSLDAEADMPVVLRGQVVPRVLDDLAPGATAYLSAAGSERVCALSEFGEFVFDGVPVGGATLQIAVGSTLIHVPQVPAAA